MKNLLLLGLLICFPLYSFAGDSEREKIAIEIFNAQHITEQLNSQLEMLKGGAVDSMSRNMFNKAMSDNPKLSKIPKDKAIEVMTNFIKRNMNAITAEMMLTGIARIYADELSIKELNTILAYYKSPIGQKDIAATAKATTALAESMIKVFEQQLDQSFGDLVNDLIQLSKEQ